MTLTPPDFARFIEEVHGFAPYPWQLRLATEIRQTGRWPDLVDLPTGSGKTTLIDIWTFLLALGAGEGEGPKARIPTRLFYVVDRRVIVDQAYRHAGKLRRALRGARPGTVTAAVAEALTALSGGSEPLERYLLRGGIYRDDAWVRSLRQPAILTATVDQVGSRLLFRGYGVTPQAWPVHAALTAHDSLVLLDEAHCARPFSQTAQAVASWLRRAPQALDRPLQVVALTATPADPDPEARAFRLRPEERLEPRLAPRLSRPKPCRLQRVEKAAGKSWQLPLARALAEEALSLLGPERAKLAVICNRVRTAEQTWLELQAAAARKGSPLAGGQAILLTGRMRPLDRDRVVEALHQALARPEPLVVVATQCLEVGADLDFDGLVSECASLDALRQRFGRLNRAGRPIEAQASVLVAEESLKGPDPIYGHALQATWEWLEQLDRGGALDLSPDGMDRALEQASASNPLIPSSLLLTAPEAPTLLPAHLDLLCQTSPAPAVEPDIAAWLHGPTSTSPDVLVCWRTELDLEVPEATRVDLLALCPPKASECVALPIGLVRGWLSRALLRLDDLSDLESAAFEERASDPEAPPRRAVRWRGAEESRWIDGGDPIRPGDTLVLPASCLDELALPTVSGQPPDLAEQALAAGQRPARLRLHPDILARTVDPATREAWTGWLRATLSSDEEDPLAEPRALLESLPDPSPEAPRWLRAVVAALRERPGQVEALPYPDEERRQGILLQGPARVTLPDPDEAEEPVPGDLGLDSSRSTRAVPLEEHLAAVSQRAAAEARWLGLPAHLVRCLEEAGRAHDLGKADLRFQSMLRNGLPAREDRLLAKSSRIPPTRQARAEARRRSGYPDGARHELLSVTMAQALGLPGEAQDGALLLHLIAAHHGRARPFAPFVSDPAPARVRIPFTPAPAPVCSSRTGLERLDSGVADRFWQTTRRYGWWGLALLEAVLRLADWEVSRQEALGGRKGAQP